MVENARQQLELGEMLGYGTKADYQPLYTQLDDIQTKTGGGKSGTGIFDTIKASLKGLKEHLLNETNACDRFVGPHGQTNRSLFCQLLKESVQSVTCPPHGCTATERGSGVLDARNSYPMLAMNYRGPLRVRIDQKPMPEILHPQDAIVRVTRSCICGSDLHLYNGSVPDTRPGMTFGHEFTGVVEQVGDEVQKLEVGDHVLVLSTSRAASASSANRRYTETAMSPTPKRRQSAAFSAIRTRRVATMADRRNTSACLTQT